VKRVLVTGCGGFVGPYVAEVLGNDGIEVWGTDQSRSALGLPDDRYRRCELTDGKAVDALLGEVQPDAIVHLAAQSSAGRSFAEPAATIKNNVLPVLHILEYLRTTRVATKLLAVGSADIYGPVKPGELPLAETRAPNPVNPYSLSKTFQEQICGQFASLHGVDVVMTRSFNHTGRGQRDTFVLSSFARQIVEIRTGRREPVVAAGNIDVRRDFSDVRDVAGAYLALLRKGKSGETYNVCSGKSHSLRELLEKTADLAGVRIEIRIDADRLRPVDMEELRGDPSKIAGHTGWSAKIPIETTLGMLLDYWSETMGDEKESGND
jgi:GDP-4-dehydro-6-deoxy-D-mannose reductase